MVPDGGLQPERTSLAWRRTGLVGVVASFALARAAVVRGSLVVAILCAVTLVAAAATLVQGIGELRRDENGGFDPPFLPRAATITVVVTVVVGLTGSLLILTG